jgi:flavodoxin
MKILVVYDSIFGNTEQIARSICKAIGSQKGVSILRVGEAKSEALAGLDLLIVGSPTRAFRPTPGIQNLLRKIPWNDLKGVKVAAFDTGIPSEDIQSPIGRFFVNAFGYAAKPVADKLVRKGGELVIPPEGFHVKGTEGPLKEGETERAADWARRIMAASGIPRTK